MNYLGKYKKPILTGFLIGISVVVALLIVADFEEVMRVFGEIDKPILPLIFVLASLNYFFRYLKWNYYLKIGGIFPEPKMNRYIFMSGLSMTTTPGKIGELLKCYLLSKEFQKTYL